MLHILRQPFSRNTSGWLHLKKLWADASCKSFWIFLTALFCSLKYVDSLYKYKDDFSPKCFKFYWSDSWYFREYKLFRTNFFDSSLYKKLSFRLTLSLVNVNKSAVSCRFGQIYWRNPYWKISFFVQWFIQFCKN